MYSIEQRLKNILFEINDKNYNKRQKYLLYLQNNKRQIYLLLKITNLLTNKNRLLCCQNHKHEHFFWEELWSPF
jgi:hypothetical protein